MVGNVGLWRAKNVQVEESNRRLENGRAMPLEMPTTSKTDKNKGTIASVFEFNFYFTLFVPLVKFRNRNIQSLKII